MATTDSIERDLRGLMDLIGEQHPKLLALARAESVQDVPPDERPDMAEYVAIAVEMVRVGRACVIRLARELDALKAGQDASR